MNKKEFENNLKELRLNIKEFAEISGVPYNTALGWDGDKKPFPSWLFSWLENYKELKELQNFKKNNCDLKSDLILKKINELEISINDLKNAINQNN